MPRALRWTGAAMAAAALATSVTGIVVSAVAASQGAHQDVPLVGLAAFLVAVLAPASVGLFVALRRPGNRVAWILLAGPLSVAVVMTAGAIAALALHEHPGSTLGAWATLVAFEWPVLFLWPLALAFVFPDGHLPSLRWRPAAAVAAVASAGIVTLLFLAPELDGP
jgi:two-component system NarL family sensor kinase